MSKDWGDIVEEQERHLSSQVNSLKIEGDLKPATNYQANSNNSKHEPVQQPRQNENKAENAEDENEPTAAEVSLIRKILRSKLLQTTKEKVEVERKDPNSPLYSVKSFEELNLRPALLKGIYALGFVKPSKIQETALPTLLANPSQNMIAQSQSGTGKTAAFVLAMLSRVDTSKRYPQVLCLSPTYELTIQTYDFMKKMAQFCPEITIRTAVRGQEVQRGESVNEHIILGTPGKVMDWSTKFRCFDLKKIKVFVLDEADVMIATQGHRDQSIRIHKGLDIMNCQTMMFSATYDEEVMDFAETIVPNAVTIKLKREEESLDNIKQYYVDCRTIEDKYSALANIYGSISIGQAIIFCHTRATASWLSEKMARDGHAVALLSGELSIEQRISVLNRFRESKEKVLITTNVCARGIDIEQVTIVVNFDLPLDKNRRPDFETYLHRIGRTGRFGKSGIAINMLNYSSEGNHLIQIEKHFKKKISPLDAEDVDEIEKIGHD